MLLNFGRAMIRPVGILHVKILRAMKLKRKDFVGSSDPYVKFKLTEDKLPSKKTTVKHNHLNPEWNEEFNMAVKDPESQALELTVYDWEQVFFFGFVFEQIPEFKVTITCSSSLLRYAENCAFIIL